MTTADADPDDVRAQLPRHVDGLWLGPELVDLFLERMGPAD